MCGLRVWADTVWSRRTGGACVADGLRTTVTRLGVTLRSIMIFSTEQECSLACRDERRVHLIDLRGETWHATSFCEVYG